MDHFCGPTVVLFGGNVSTFTAFFSIKEVNHVLHIVEEQLLGDRMLAE